MDNDSYRAQCHENRGKECKVTTDDGNTITGVYHGESHSEGRLAMSLKLTGKSRDQFAFVADIDGNRFDPAEIGVYIDSIVSIEFTKPA